MGGEQGPSEKDANFEAPSPDTEPEKLENELRKDWGLTGKESGMSYQRERIIKLMESARKVQEIGEEKFHEMGEDVSRRILDLCVRGARREIQDPEIQQAVERTIIPLAMTLGQSDAEFKLSSDVPGREDVKSFQFFSSGVSIRFAEIREGQLVSDRHGLDLGPIQMEDLDKGLETNIKDYIKIAGEKIEFENVLKGLTGRKKHIEALRREADSEEAELLEEKNLLVDAGVPESDMS